ncbi:MAG: Gfo/Idh/MocA family oxidoreductase [Nitrososphaera sp.]|nr:Gfo/Idh/MocA family oxidoreductase [Nitrososphaera sp.]
MKVIVVGLGQMGVYYVNSLKRLGTRIEDIIGIDIDPEKTAAAGEQFPGAVIFQSTASITDMPQVAIVATNTPSHVKVIHELRARGVEWVFCEKPIGMDAKEAVSLKDCGATVYTAFLINFSKAVEYLLDRMGRESLYFAEGSVEWGKDRTGNSRPTPGDLEDESVHGIGVIHTLVRFNQGVQHVQLAANLSHLSFVKREAQRKACAIDASFPERPNSSTFVLETIRTDRGLIPVSVHSSFIMNEQVRRVSGRLVDQNNRPKYAFLIEFDVKGKGGKTVDMFHLRELGVRTEEAIEFSGDKIDLELSAFLDVVEGKPASSRLTNLQNALHAVEFSDAVRQSSRNATIIDLYF